MVVLTGGWLLGWALLGRRHRLDEMASSARRTAGAEGGGGASSLDGSTSVSDSTSGSDVSVVIPARNEAERLPRLLAALAEADPAPTEVIVVDDGSTDATAHIARTAGARVIHVDPPDGWTGKAWACHSGAAVATGDVLVFFDADTEPAPEAVGLLAASARDGAFASVQPTHRVESWYERISAGPAMITALGAGIGPTPRGRFWRRPMAFGPAIAVRSDVYRRIGGHAAVRTEVAEDLALAREADAAGVPVRSALGEEHIRYRMYPEGIASLLEGWSKNLALGAGATPLLRLAAVVVWIAAALRAPMVLLSDPGLLPLAAFAAFVAQVGLVLHRIGRFGPATAVAYPLVLLAFVSLFVRSTALTARGRPVPWRGRLVRVRT